MATRSALVDALRVLGTEAYGRAQHEAIADALDIVAEVPPERIDETVDGFVAWLLSQPRQLEAVRNAPVHSPLSQLGVAFRKFAEEEAPDTPVGRLRQALLTVVDGNPRGWFARTAGDHVHLSRDVAGAWPVSLLKEDNVTLRPEALELAAAALLADAGRAMSAAEMARALLEHFPATFDEPIDADDIAEEITTDGETPAVVQPARWGKQHAAQLLCRFPHEELILIAARMRDTPETETAARLAWNVATVRAKSEAAWIRLEEHLGALEQSTGHSAKTLVGMVEQVLLDMDLERP